MSGRGLFDRLAANPASLILIEDCETILEDKSAKGVLRSALWSQSRDMPMSRPVTWNVRGQGLDQFAFTGSIVITANCKPEAFSAEVGAIKTRIATFQFKTSREEVEARMRQIARKGFKFGRHVITLKDCAEIAEYVIGEISARQKPPDLRILTTVFKDVLQHREGLSETPWKDLAAVRIGEDLNAAASRAAANSQKEDVIVALEQASRQVGAPQSAECPDHPRRVLACNVAYFRHNQAFMAYPAYRRKGWPIGSGNVEAGAKQFNKRVKGTEQFWQPEGAEAMLCLRALWIAQDRRWQRYWRARPAYKAA